ncbi:acetylornithine deacetylase [Granulicoccus phenolivorans]|uniref:acetylornithine deacetylase n=1 Tax=Granulicoccus phenolivorans TaxID=266854 RepID=UPI000423284C|nr:acetylornithine deacetylase [Granulicoccus phenolivorans]
MPEPRSLDWAQRLIRIDSTSRISNRPVIDLIAAEATRLGLDPQLCPNPDGTKANLLITVPAADGTRSGGVILSGHSDCVPVDGQDWTSDPFTPEVRDGKLYGRGSADMKGYLGVLVTLLPDMIAARLTEPIHLAISYDEEPGCVGGEQIVRDIAERGLAPRAAVIGEPSMMRVITGHKSVTMGVATVRGRAAHSSLTNQGVNAIEYAARLIGFLREIGVSWRTEGPFDEGYEVMYSTIGTNLIHGGIVVNTVPQDCTFEFDFRTIPAVDMYATMDRIRAKAAELEAEMQAVDPATFLRIEARVQVPGLGTDPDADVVALAHRLGGIPSTDQVTYGTEAGQFSRAGMPAVVCGPGDIQVAHRADEFVPLEQLVAAEEFVLSLIAELS